jgi:hypothetical protein
MKREKIFNHEEIKEQTKKQNKKEKTFTGGAPNYISNPFFWIGFLIKS